MKKSSESLASMTMTVAFSVLNAGCGLVGIRTAETPAYSVLQKDGDFEIREYAERLVAKTKNKGTFKESQNSAFRILAGYIFGDNESKQKISMTAPVTQARSSEKIAMTAPVTQGKKGDEWIMAFTMPSKYKLDTLPKPKDPRIEFEVLKPQKIAVIRFTGTWSEEKNASKAMLLTEWLSKQQMWKLTSDPAFAGYDPPWTLPFLRRNEVMIEISEIR